MVLHNPNNWHWVNKDAAPWAKQWMEENIKDVTAEEGGVTAQLDKLISMDGDVDVSQRKGKVITIFDVRLVLEYSGKTKDDEDVSGTITVPEVAHDTEENDSTSISTPMPIRRLLSKTSSVLKSYHNSASILQSWALP